MTRKDYQLIASAFRDLTLLNIGMSNDYKQGNWDASCKAVSSLCTLLKQDNPNFDEDKFIEACGFDPGNFWHLHP
jgi:hypothetical protein